MGAWLIVMALASLPVAAFAYSSGICAGATCSAAEVGVFMQGISGACGNQGDCTLSDILLLFVNVANFVLGLIGAIVLLMYVIGGFYWLTSGGSPGRVTKGKEYLKISTYGLLIVLFAYIGIQFLLETLTEGQVTIPTEACIGKQDGTPCGEGLLCKGQVCIQTETPAEPAGPFAQPTP